MKVKELKEKLATMPDNMDVFVAEQKTAIQELIEYFEQQLRLQCSGEIKYTTEEALLDAIEVCKNAQITKEKEQILAHFLLKQRDC